ncbi:YolD-like family protein [Paenibacillus pini]|uniref:YolD-like protein n=1 Tax=Paenibacillus pini JCM 16418 TaxID=1236976 RepID=W7Z8W6_9BACL|nr:YolD-like family protein [Paenibacillus pini]GAF10914.1 hypothetical protein JCM16418_5150 [Paenibacillus pini JCM 16418]
MTKKLSGNGLWESSRMMLPEHKERINQNQKEHKIKTRPVIHDDEWENILYNLGISLSEKEVVEVTLFDTYSDRIVIGVVTNVVPHQKKFKVEFDNDSGYEWVDFEEVVRARIH